MASTTLQGVDPQLEVRQRAVDAPLHPESLLHVPLIRQAFCDLNFRLIRRAVDPYWTYNGILPISVTGFNPFAGAFFYGHTSCFSRWLTDPFGSARDFNENDFLVKEALFMAHDYLHAWAYQVMDRAFPEKKILSGPITQESFEDLAFCHLMTEAVATVGLDYWFLCNRTVNQYCPIGSNIGPLTVSYREARLPEYRHFCPDLEVQTPEFFHKIATFYCSGSFPGFGVEDLKRSPQLLSWLKHELQYGGTQRRLTRSWLRFLAAEEIDLPAERLTAPIQLEDPFRQAVIARLAVLLWEKVHEETISSTPEPTPWNRGLSHRLAPRSRTPDFRFLNVGLMKADELRKLGPVEKENFEFFLYQYLAGIPLSSVPKQKLGYVALLKQQRDIPLVLDLMGALKRMEPFTEEPRDLFTAN